MYTLLETIGQGAFGSVHIALKNGTKYVMKVVPAEQFTLQSWLNEIDTIRKVSTIRKTFLQFHEAFIYSPATKETFYDTDFDISDYIGLEYILVTEYIENAISLFDYSLMSPIAKQELFIARELVEQLMLLHAFGIVHGDIKPGNVIVVPHEGKISRILFIDFGLSCIVKDCYLGGTLGYAAPEIDPGLLLTFEEAKKTDVYSLGVVFQEMGRGTNCSLLKELGANLTLPNASIRFTLKAALGKLNKYSVVTVRPPVRKVKKKGRSVTPF